MEINLKTDVKDILQVFKADKQNKSKSYPVKTTLNLGAKPKSINSPSRAIPIFIAMMGLIVLFGKFCVADRLSFADQAESAATQAEAALASLKEQTATYEALRAEYDRRVFPELIGDEAYSTDVMDILELIESRLMREARVHAFSVQEPVITLQLSGVTLNDTAALVKSLESSPLVNSVMVYTAGTEETPSPTPTPVPTPTPKPTRTPKLKKGQTPVPTQSETPVSSSPAIEAPVMLSMTITLKQGGEA